MIDDRIKKECCGLSKILDLVKWEGGKREIKFLHWYTVRFSCVMWVDFQEFRNNLRMSCRQPNNYSGIISVP